VEASGSEVHQIYWGDDSQRNVGEFHGFWIYRIYPYIVMGWCKGKSWNIYKKSVLIEYGGFLQFFP
jgi:hypothetical protein